MFKKFVFMRRRPQQKEFYLSSSPLALLFLSACGGGSSENSSNDISYSGSVMKGPLENALVFLDYNGDGILGADEPSVRTQADGSFSLQGAFENVGFVAKTDATTIDNSSGEILENITLKAPVGASVVTPATTIMEEAGISAEEVASVLGLPEGIDPLTFNPYSPDADPEQALAVEKISQQVMTTINAVSTAVESAGADKASAFSLALETVVEVVKEKAEAKKADPKGVNTILDLTKTDEIAVVTEKVSKKIKETGIAREEDFEAVRSQLDLAVGNVNTQITEVSDLTSEDSMAAFAVATILNDQVKAAVKAKGNSDAKISFTDKNSIKEERDNKSGEIKEKIENGELTPIITKTTDSDETATTVSTGSESTGPSPNQPPYVSSALNDQTVVAGTKLTFQISPDNFRDPEGGPLTYTATLSDGQVLPSWLSFDPLTFTFSGTTTTEDIGSLDVIVTVTDGSSNSVSDAFQITVMGSQKYVATHDVSIMEAKPSDRGNWGDVEVYSKPDAGIIALLQFDVPSGLSAGGLPLAQIKLPISYVKGSSGKYNIFATDNAAWSENSVTWASAPTKGALIGSFEVNSEVDHFIDVSQALSSAIEASSSTFTIWLEGATEEYQSFKFHSIRDDQPSHPELIISSESFSSKNSAPTLENTISDQSLVINTSLSFQVPETTFQDSDTGDILTYSAELADGSDLPTWLYFDASSRTFSGTPAYGDIGELNIKVMAEDTAFASITDNFTLTIQDNLQGAQKYTAKHDVSIFEANQNGRGNWGDVEIYAKPGSEIVGLIQFDVPAGLSSTSHQANLKLPVSYVKGSGGQFKIFATDNNSWSEKTVSWASASVPTKGSLIDTFEIKEAVDFTVDVSSALTSAVTNNDTSITFWIEGATDNYQSFKFHSIRDDQPSHPELLISSDSFSEVGINNSPQVLNSIPDQVTIKGDAFSFKIPSDTFFDIDSGDTFKYFATLSDGSDLPDWLTFDEKTQTFTGTPTESDAGSTVDVKVTATDAPELKLLGVAWEYDKTHGKISADLSSLTEINSAEPITYTWFADNVKIDGATDKSLVMKTYQNLIENKSITAKVEYTDASGNQVQLTSTPIDYSNFRIFVGAEGGSLIGDNPFPLKEGYSFNGSSDVVDKNGDRYVASDVHSVNAVLASDLGIAAREGQYVIQFKAKESSNRTELANVRQANFYEGEDFYFSGSFYLQSDEWDVVTKHKTIISQLKQMGGGNPNFALKLSNEGDYQLYVQSIHHGVDNEKIAVARRDDWNDLKFYMKQSTGDDGLFKIWLNGSLVYDYQGATLHKKDVGGFLKFGMYTGIHDERSILWDAVEYSDYEIDRAAFSTQQINSSVSDTFQISVAAANSAPTITVPTPQSVTEDSTSLTLTGGLSGSDAEGDTLSFSLIGKTAVNGLYSSSGLYGSLTLDATSGNYSYRLNNSADLVQNLDSGDTVQDTFSVEVSDGISSSAAENLVFNIVGAAEPSGSSVTTTSTGDLRLLGSLDQEVSGTGTGGTVALDLSRVSGVDATKAISYKWFANGIEVSGATSSSIKLDSYDLSTESIHADVTYTNTSGQLVTLTSDTFKNHDWRIFSGGEDGSVAGENPSPFWETYSYNDNSVTHEKVNGVETRFTASAVHSVTSALATDYGISAREGDYILRFHGDSSNYGSSTDKSFTKRVEIGNRDWNTRSFPDEAMFVSASILLPKAEWDPVTLYSTILFQQKQYPGADPNFELRLSNEGDYKLYAQSAYGHYNLSGDAHDDHLIATLSPDTWHDLRIHLVPSQDASKGYINIYLDGVSIFEKTGTNLNDRDNTDFTFLKMGMYTNIRDDRTIFFDAVEMTNSLETSVGEWATNGVNAPSISIQAPSNNATIASGESVILTSNATDPSGSKLFTSGSVIKVEYFDGSTSLGLGSGPNNVLSFFPEDGTSTIRAVVTDADGLTATDTITLKTGNQAPDVVLTALETGQNLTIGQSINLTATASDPDGAVAKVEFFINGTSIGADTNPNAGVYSVDWTPNTAGAFVVTTRALDDDGKQGDLSSKSVTVGATIDTAALIATHDGVIDFTGNDTPGNSASIDAIENWSGNEIFGGTNKRVLLLKFDVSSLESSSEVQAASLDLFCDQVAKIDSNPSTTPEVLLYAATSDTWDTPDSASNAPDKGDFLFSIDRPTKTGAVSFDITSYVNEKVDASANYLSFWLEVPNGNQDQLRFSNNSEGAKAPTLNIQTSSVELTTVSAAGIPTAPEAKNHKITFTAENGVNVLEAAGLVESSASDINSDTLTISGIRIGKESEVGTAGTVGSSLSGTYGNLIVQSDGSYSYTANDTAKNAGETVYDFFAFTVSDGTYTDDATLILEII